MDSNNKKKLAYNFFSLGFVQVINVSLQLLVIPFVIKAIGVDGFGIVAVAQVVMIYLSTLTDFGFNQTATRFVSINRDNNERISSLFSRVVMSKLILSIIAFALLLLLLICVPLFRNHYFLYLMSFTFVIGQSTLISWLFQGMEKMWFNALTNLVSRVLFVLFVFLFIRHKEDDFLFLFLMGLGNIIAGSLSILLAFRIFKLKYIRPSSAELIQELQSGWQYTITNLSMNTCQYANIFILRFFSNDLLVGYYSIAERIFIALKQMLGIFSQTIYPRICVLIQQGKKQVTNFLNQVYIPFLISIIIISLIIFLFSPRILYFFAGNEAIQSVYILRTLCIALIIVCLNIPSTLILLALNKRKKYFRIYVTGSIINIIANILLASFFKTSGTLTAIFLTEFFITVSVFWASRQSAKDSKASESIQL